MIFVVHKGIFWGNRDGAFIFLEKVCKASYCLVKALIYAGWRKYKLNVYI